MRAKHHPTGQFPTVQQRLASLGGIIGPGPHRGHNLRIASPPALAHIVVKNLGALTQAGAICQVHIWQQTRVQMFIESIALSVHQLLGKIHVNQSFVNLDHAILRTGWDTQLFRFGLEHQIGLHRQRNFDVEVLA